MKVGEPNRIDLESRLRPATVLWPGDSKAVHADVFPETMRFILDQFILVEPLYQLEKEGRLTGDGELGRQAKPFLEGQILKAAQFLGDLWFTAWQQAPPDTFLRSQLARRKLSTGPKSAEKP